MIERMEFEASNRRVLAEGGEPAAGRAALMVITKASGATCRRLIPRRFQPVDRSAYARCGAGLRTVAGASPPA